MQYNKINVTYSYNGNIYIANEPTEHIDFFMQKTKNSIKINLKSNVDIKIISCKLYFDHNYKQDDKVFVNGYQSWTFSKEYDKSQVQYGLKNLSKLGFIRNYTDFSGDYQFVKYPETEGEFHSFSYGYIRSVNKFYFIGSITEKYGFTIIKYSFANNRLVVVKDIEGIKIQNGQEYEIFNLVLFEGAYEEIFDRYFSAMDVQPPRLKRVCGYTSWYNYFGKISEDILLDDLYGTNKLAVKPDFFQIDDGYQSAVGDWLEIRKDKFPNGMKYICDEIHTQGMKAGIWLAPLLCQKSSNIAKQHPSWMLREPSSKKIHLGALSWGGAYILDIENIEVKQYLEKVFDVVLNEWGFDMVKLDFLYSACLYPRNNKSRGQIMHETLDFLRNCVGEKYILGCGVPLASSFGKVDMCRVGCDIDLSYKPKFYTKITNQEIVCTQNNINNTIFRRHLNGRAFALDPDVFFVRDENLKFTQQQKNMLQSINSMLGGVLFVSDNIGRYSNQQIKEVQDVFSGCPYKVEDAYYQTEDIIKLECRDEAKNIIILLLDLKKGEITKIKM